MQEDDVKDQVIDDLINKKELTNTESMVLLFNLLGGDEQDIKENDVNVNRRNK